MYLPQREPGTHYFQKEKKVAIVEERAKQKRKKLEIKKSALKPVAKAVSKSKSTSTTTTTANPAKKRVSFA